MTKCLESLICLAQKLNFVEANRSPCASIVRKYRPILLSKSEKRIKEVSSIIESVFMPVYSAHRESILDKDFSFCSETSITFDGVDFALAFMNAIESDNEVDIKKIQAATNEFLFLFYHMAPEADRKIILERHSNKTEQKEAQKPEIATIAKGAGKATGDVAKRLESLLSKNSAPLREAEQDPSKIPKFISGFLENNSSDITDIVSDVLNSMGIDPSSMK